MTLHKAVELIKKVGIGAGIGLGIIIVMIVIFRVGGVILRIVNPPKTAPANHAYDILPFINFPQSATDNSYTYILNTISGTLPTDFPDRLAVFPLTAPEPSLLNLEKAKEKARTLGFVDQQNKTIPETPLGNGLYEWAEATGINRKLKIDTVTFNFTLTSTYLANLTVLGAENLSDENNAVQTAKEFLESIGLLHEDLDMDKFLKPEENTIYNTYPRLYAIQNGAIVPTSSLSTAQVIRVDFHQKDVEYELDTGVPKAPSLKMKLPIRYPHPPFSTMNFWVAGGQNKAEISAAIFTHFGISKPEDTLATYPIKTAEAALEELQNGNAYIASYEGLDNEILISNVYLAYYLGNEQEYLMPIIVFEGQNGFFAYVSAITDEWIE